MNPNNLGDLDLRVKHGLDMLVHCATCLVQSRNIIYKTVQEIRLISIGIDLNPSIAHMYEVVDGLQALGDCLITASIQKEYDFRSSHLELMEQICTDVFYLQTQICPHAHFVKQKIESLVSIVVRIFTDPKVTVMELLEVLPGIISDISVMCQNITSICIAQGIHCLNHLN